MGCTGSKDKTKKPDPKKEADANAAKNTAAEANNAAAPANNAPSAHNDAATASQQDSAVPPPPAAAAADAPNPAPQAAPQSPSNKSVEAPAGRATQQDLNATDVASTAAPGKGPRRTNSEDGAAAGNAGGDVDEEGNPVVLPKGDWVKTEGTPYYYSATENLYYHPPSCQFYDPTNEMWYDPEKDEWYHDDASDEEAAA